MQIYRICCFWELCIFFVLWHCALHKRFDKIFSSLDFPTRIYILFRVEYLLNVHRRLLLYAFFTVLFLARWRAGCWLLAGLFLVSSIPPRCSNTTEARDAHSFGFYEWNSTSSSRPIGTARAPTIDFEKPTALQWGNRSARRRHHGTQTTKYHVAGRFSIQS